MTLLQALFSFKGRLNRAKFWLMTFLIICTAGFLSLIDGLLPEPMEDEIAGPFFSVVLFLADVFLIWSFLSVTAKRWHDRDKSAWWILIWLIPVIGWLWVPIELGFLKGTTGANRFGPDSLPKTSEIILVSMLFSFKGRMNRLDFWLVRILILGVFFILFAIIEMNENGAISDRLAGQIALPLVIICMWSALATGVKRNHDLDRPGWLTAIEWIPVLGLVYTFFSLGYTKGTVGRNRFGPDPLEYS